MNEWMDGWMNEKGFICLLLRDLLVSFLSCSRLLSVCCCLFVKFSPAKCACESVSLSLCLPWPLSLLLPPHLRLSLPLCPSLCAHQLLRGMLPGLSVPPQACISPSSPGACHFSLSLRLCVSVSLSVGVLASLALCSSPCASVSAVSALCLLL